MSSLFQNLAAMPQPQLLHQIYTRNHSQNQPPLPPPDHQPPLPPPVHQPPITGDLPSTSPAPSKPTVVFQESSSYKNHLQEYTQKRGIPLPLYKTVNEGSPHVPMFRSTVVVNGVSCTSTKSFLQKRAAEIDVARLALLNVVPQPPHVKEVKEETCSLHQEDLFLCKAILKECADKINVEIPNYKTEKANGSSPAFVSSLTFNGKQYVGDEGRSKKDSQQLAARAVILSILGSDSDARDVLCKIVKSKQNMFCTAKGKVKNPCNTQNVGMPVGIKTESFVGTSASKANELEVVVNDNVVKTATQEPCSVNQSSLSAKPVSLVAAIATPVMSVPSNLEQQVVGSTSLKKRKRKAKKSENKVGIDAQVQVAAVPSCQATTSTDYSDRICAPNNCASLPGSHNAVLSGT